MTQFHLPGPLFLIGCGNMAGAMLEGWLAAGADPRLITVVRPSGRVPAPGIRTLTALPEDEVPALVLLGVKPQKLAEVAPRRRPGARAGDDPRLDPGRNDPGDLARPLSRCPERSSRPCPTFPSASARA